MTSNSSHSNFVFENIFQLYNRIQNMLYFDSTLMHIIDLRDKDYFATSHIKNAINIPMTGNDAANKQNIISSLKQIVNEKQQISDYDTKININPCNNAWDDTEKKIDINCDEVFDEDQEYFYIYHHHGKKENDNKQIFAFIQLIYTVIAEQYNNKTQLLFRILSAPFQQFYAIYPFLCSTSNSKTQNEILSYPNCILEGHLYLGGGGHASNYKIFSDLKITHCINVTKHVQCYFECKTPEIKYLNLKIDDMHYERIDKYFEIAHRFINNALYDIDAEFVDSNPFVMERHKRVAIKGRVCFVHCQGGVSRSASIVISYLMKTKNMKMMDAMDYVSHRRPVISPNSGFTKQLKSYEIQLFGDPNSHYLLGNNYATSTRKKECVIT